MIYPKYDDIVEWNENKIDYDYLLYLNGIQHYREGYKKGFVEGEETGFLKGAKRLQEITSNTFHSWRMNFARAYIDSISCHFLLKHKNSDGIPK